MGIEKNFRSNYLPKVEPDLFCLTFCNAHKSFLYLRNNKTGLQPISRLVEQVYYFGGWVEGAKSFWCQGFMYLLTVSPSSSKP